MKVSEYILNLKPYQPGKPIEETQREYGLDRVDKLASNESPIGPSEKVLAAVQEAAKEIHRYPDASFYKLKNRFSKEYDIGEQHLTFGNGSNELIDLLIRVYCQPGDKILTSKGAFIAYKICAQAAGVDTLESELTSGLKVDLDHLLSLYKEHKPNLIFIPNPNNPTGTYVPFNELKSFVNELSGDDKVKIVVDEAYNEYVRAEDYGNTKNLFSENGNVIVLRTFSKIFGLAGLRVGSMIADTKTIDYVNRIRNPFNVNSLAQAAALAILDDKPYIEKAQKTNWQGLDYFYKELKNLEIPYIESQTNFVLFDCEKPAGPVFEQLLKQGVIVRPIAAYGLPNHLRMSVGLPDENERAVAALKATLRA